MSTDDACRSAAIRHGERTKRRQQMVAATHRTFDRGVTAVTSNLIVQPRDFC
jgi:hypothetical protein